MPSERYTRKDAEACFKRLCETLDKRIATSYNDVGAWSLDHNATYGGYVVDEITTDGGGISKPLGDRRRPAREFCEAVWFALRVLENA